MLALFFDPDSRVLLVRFSGTLDSEDLERHRSLRQRVRDVEGDVPAILDLLTVGHVSVPTDRVRAASLKAPSLLGHSRVVVARPGTEAFGLARLFITVRQGAGHAQPALVQDMDEAFRLLGLDKPSFCRWPCVMPSSGA